MRLDATMPLSWATATAVPRMHFQPIVDLRSQAVVGYEALARGPLGSPWERPQALFTQARAEDRLREVDWACRTAAVRDMLTASTPAPPWRLFLNTEAEVLGSTCPDELVEDWTGAVDELQVVVEVTARALVHGPRRLVEAVAELRELGCEIALDDVGANETSLALLPLVEPDVVKLEAALLRRPYRRAARAALRAVERYVQRTGALLVAEGVETTQDHAQALELGAQLGQGYLFGRPEPLDPRALAGATGGPPRKPRTSAPPAVLPDVTAPASPRLVVTPTWVSDHLRAVVQWAAAEASSNVLLVRLPDPSVAPAGLLPTLDELRETLPLSAVVLGAGRSGRWPSPRPAGTQERLDTVVVLLGAAEAHVMVARPRDDGRYDVTVSDRSTQVAAAARAFIVAEL